MENFISHLNTADANFDQKQYEEAVKYYSLAIKAEPMHPKRYRVFYKRGISRYKLKFFQDAIRDFTLTIKTLPKDQEIFSKEEIVRFKSLAYFQRAKAEAKTKNYAEAIEHYSKVIELDCASTSVYFNRGGLLAKIGNISEAIDDLIQAKNLTQDKSLIKRLQDRIDIFQASLALTPPYSDESEDNNDETISKQVTINSHKRKYSEINDSLTTPENRQNSFFTLENANDNSKRRKLETAPCLPSLNK